MARRAVLAGAAGAAGAVLAAALAAAAGIGADPPGADAQTTAGAGGTPVAAAHARPLAARVPRKDRLAPFPSCAALVRQASGRAAALAGPYGYGGYPVAWTGRVPMPTDVVAMPLPAAAPREGAPATGGGAAAPDYSGTNVQEAGVDEPDLVETDGRTVFTAVGGVLRAVSAGDGAAQLGRLELGEGGGDAQLLLMGDRMLVISEEWGYVRGPEVIAPGVAVGGAAAAPISLAPGRQRVIVRLVDVRDPSSMRVVETLTVEGRFLGARAVDGAVRLVISTSPDPVPFAYPSEDTSEARAEALRRNRAALRSAPARTWLPVETLTRRGRAPRSRLAVRCRDVRRPTQFAGLDTLSVLTIDPSRGLEPVDRDAVMTDGDIVYGSATSLYVTTPRWVDPDAATDDLPAGAVTQVHRFDTSAPGTTAYRSSGRVPGYLLSQWAMSEQGGFLRVASTSEPPWMDASTTPTRSRVTVLAEHGTRLDPVGRVTGLGEGERIRAVRFIGDVGYVVTFRQTDPLYVVDLSRPTAPVVRGELKIPGYSAYLHPVGDGLLLGVGQDADSGGRVQGTQVSLFDVNDPARPRRVAHLVVPGGWSEAEDDHHAFLWWAPSSLAVVPVQRGDAGDSVSRAVGVRVTPGGIARVGSVGHPTVDGRAPSIRRSLVVGDRLVTVSDAGVGVATLDGLTPVRFVPFR